MRGPEEKYRDNVTNPKRRKLVWSVVQPKIGKSVRRRGKDGPLATRPTGKGLFSVRRRIPSTDPPSREQEKRGVTRKEFRSLNKGGMQVKFASRDSPVRREQSSLGGKGLDKKGAGEEIREASGTCGDCIRRPATARFRERKKLDRSRGKGKVSGRKGQEGRLRGGGGFAEAAEVFLRRMGLRREEAKRE